MRDPHPNPSPCAQGEGLIVVCIATFRVNLPLSDCGAEGGNRPVTPGLQQAFNRTPYQRVSGSVRRERDSCRHAGWRTPLDVVPCGKDCQVCQLCQLRGVGWVGKVVCISLPENPRSRGGHGEGPLPRRKTLTPPRVSGPTGRERGVLSCEWRHTLVHLPVSAHRKCGFFGPAIATVARVWARGLRPLPWGGAPARRGSGEWLPNTQ